MNPEEPFIKRYASVNSKRMLRQVRKYLVTGVLVTAPIAITLYLAYVFLVFMDRQVANILPGDWQPAYGESIFPGSGIVITVAFFILVGWLATNFLGKICVDISDKIMTHMPILRTLYTAVKQVVETLIGSQAKAFREVVLVEYPRKGSWTLGFVTGIADGEIKAAIPGDELLNIFVPTAPSPVNGFLLFIPRKECIPMQMSVDEGIKMVVSVGIITPTAPQKNKAA